MEYVHGGDIYTHKGMTDFSVNLNPFGPGRAVVEAARKSIDQIGNYPDASCRKLKSALAKRLEVPAEHIICGNGAADLIFTAVLADCPRKALIPVPAFAEYEQALRATGCEICYYKKREATGFQLEEDFLDLLNEDIDMVFLCSPDNPTGKLIDRSMLWKILARCETYGIRMVLDECFIDFAENAATASILADTKRWRTLFILRSLTKMHAIPGIRIGYAVTSDMEFLEKMDPAGRNRRRRTGPCPRRRRRWRTGRLQWCPRHHLQSGRRQRQRGHRSWRCDQRTPRSAPPGCRQQSR